MVRARLRLRMKAARIPKRPAKLDTSKLKTAALEHLRNRFEGLQLDEDASPEDEWRELKDAVADASQAHLGKTCRRRRDWVTGETIALAENSKCTKSPGTEKANNEGTTPGSQRLLEGNFGRDREGGDLR